MDSVRGRKQESSWMFGFRLEVNSRHYELYAPTRQDLQHWIKIFNLLIQMYAKGFQSNKKTPQEFEKEELAREEALKPKEEYVPILRLEALEANNLLINKMGVTGEGSFHTHGNKFNLQKVAVSLNFKNGKLKSSHEGKLQNTFSLREMKQIKRCEEQSVTETVHYGV